MSEEQRPHAKRDPEAVWGVAYIDPSDANELPITYASGPPEDTTAPWRANPVDAHRWEHRSEAEAALDRFADVRTAWPGRFAAVPVGVSE